MDLRTSAHFRSFPRPLLVLLFGPYSAPPAFLPPNPPRRTNRVLKISDRSLFARPPPWGTSLRFGPHSWCAIHFAPKGFTLRNELFFEKFRGGLASKCIFRGPGSESRNPDRGRPFRIRSGVDSFHRGFLMVPDSFWDFSGNCFFETFRQNPTTAGFEPATPGTPAGRRDHKARRAPRRVEPENFGFAITFDSEQFLIDEHIADRTYS